VITDGPFAAEQVNVRDQWTDANSLLSFVADLIGTRRETAAIGSGEMTVLETDPPSAFAHRFDLDGETVAMAHNLGEDPVTVTIDVDDAETVDTLLGSGDVTDVDDSECVVSLGKFGYQWLRVDRT
jgi:maltose alpha-D-glucosyltransferase/alpha-amylase